MKLKTPTTRTALATTLLLTALGLLPGAALAQSDMKDMPGMAPQATPAPEKPTPTPTPQPAATIKAQEEMGAMPGMTPETVPAATSTPKPADSATLPAAMEAMPGMNPAKPAAVNSAAPALPKSDMSAIPGMAAPGASKTKGMAGMPGMSADETSAPERMSAPGVFILRPPQKWVPPRGDDRTSELLSREELREHMAPLPPPIEDSKLHAFALFDLFEYRANNAGPNTFVWDFVGWVGGDYNRLWLKTEGRQTLSQGGLGDGDLQLLYGRMIAPFWDFQIGARARQNFGTGFRNNTRTYAVIGFQGLAPGNFDVEPAIYISDRGEVSAELTVSADLYLTQRLVLQPRFQGEVSIQGDDRFGSDSGINETDIGLRLRYEIRREFAPYIGVSWLRSYGQTAAMARREGDPTDAVAFVVGLRLWW